MEPMTPEQHAEFEAEYLAIKQCLSVLRLTRNKAEDIAVAKARLENWLTENEGRWVGA